MTQQTVLTKFKASNTVTVNDTTRRFCYSAGVPYLTLDPKYSGLPSRMVPGGQLMTIVPDIETVVGPYDNMRHRYPRIKRLISPAESMFYLKKKFAIEVDAGFRELACLTKLPYEVTEADPLDPDSRDTYVDEGPQYFALLHPRIACEFGLEDMFISRAEGNTGATWYQACPTCRLADLESDACDTRILNSSLDRNILAELRSTLIAACRSAVVFAETKIALLDADLEKRGRGEHGRTYRNEADHIYLKMVHRTATPVKVMSPQEIITEAAKAAAVGAVSAMQTVNAPEAPVQEPTTPEGGVVLSAEEAKQYQAYVNRTSALARAREAKKEKNDGDNDPAKDEG